MPPPPADVTTSRDKGAGGVAAPNYQTVRLWRRISRRLRGEFVTRIEGTPLQFGAYGSYWRSRWQRPARDAADGFENVFLCQLPDYGAGIGHQLANWNASLYFARRFGTRFAHCPFSSPRWEEFLGLGLGETRADDLRSAGYRRVRLPRFDSANEAQVALVHGIVRSYAGTRSLLELELNQGYVAQHETWEILQRKYFTAPARAHDTLLYRPGEFNVNVHIRRRMKVEPDDVWAARGLENTYYATVLRTALEQLSSRHAVRVFLFSQGRREEFPEFEEFPEIVWCLEMNPYDSFAHMARSDLLIASKSSFSYKPALISRGISICPASFWHGYPDSPRYIVADDNGELDTSALQQAVVALQSNPAHQADSGDLAAR
jgi:hypothetical protein